MPQSERPTVSFYATIGIFVATTVLVLFGIFGIYWQTGFTTSSEAGLYGDSFGFVNSLFSALAFAGVLLALYVQIQEIQFLSDQFNDARHAQEQMARQAFFTSVATATDTWSRLAERQRIDASDASNINRAIVATNEYRYRIMIEEQLSALANWKINSGELPDFNLDKPAVKRSELEVGASRIIVQQAAAFAHEIDHLRQRAMSRSISRRQKWDDIAACARQCQIFIDSIENINENMALRRGKLEVRERLGTLDKSCQEKSAGAPEHPDIDTRDASGQLSMSLNVLIQHIGSLESVQKDLHRLALEIVGCYVQDLDEGNQTTVQVIN